MKINEPRRPAAVASRQQPRRRSASDFDVPAGPAAEPALIAPGAPLAAPASVLALQEVEDPPELRRRAAERGHDLLDELENLRLAMIEGRLSASALRRLSAMVDAGHYQVADDRLAGVLRDIEVRAAVELARRGLDERS